MNESPRVSVVMAVYNGLPYIGEQMESILKQLETGDELLVLDDGSQDGSRELVAAYAEKWPQIRLIPGSHVGLIQNFARGISQARGKVIFLADQDDIWEPNKVSRVQAVLENEAQPMVVLHDAQFVTAAGEPMSQTLFAWRKVKTGFWKNWLRNSYMGCCMAFNQELRPYILPFPERIPMHDQWIGLIAERVGKAILLPERLIRYRRHDKTATRDAPQSIFTMLRWRVNLFVQYIKRRRTGGRV